VSNDKVQVGIVGAGFVSHIHLKAFQENSSMVEVVGICAKHSEHAKELAQIYEIPRVFEAYQEMVACPQINVVDICVPTNTHEEVILAACEYQKHVICEKPLTGYFGEDQANQQEIGFNVSKRHMIKKVKEKTRKLAKAIQKSGIKFMYAENFVYAPAISKAKRLIRESGSPIIELRAEESHSGSHAAYSRWWKTAGGGSLLRMGSHPIGVALHLKHFEGQIRYGEPIKVRSVMAETAHLTKMKEVQEEKEHFIFTNWGDVEDWSTVIITFQDGSRTTIFSNDVSLGGVKNLVEIYTSQGVIYANIGPNNTMMAYAPNPHTWGDEYIAEKIETKAGWTFPFPDEDWVRGYPQEMKDFAQTILEDREPISDFLLARETAEVIYAAYLSAEEGIRIKVEDLP